MKPHLSVEPRSLDDPHEHQSEHDDDNAADPREKFLVLI
jgi:hypothetical protein